MKTFLTIVAVALAAANMKRIRQSLAIVVLLGLFGCASDRVALSCLELRDKTFYRKGEREPFTGKVYNIQKEIGRREEYSILKGKVHGPWLVWNQDGSLLGCMDYLNGQMHGYFRRWGTNGLVDCLGEFRNGRAHGAHMQWWENGQLMSSNSYENGEISQSTIYWDESGNRINEVELHMIRVHQSRNSHEPKPEGDGLKPAP